LNKHNIEELKTGVLAIELVYKHFANAVFAIVGISD